MSHFCTHVLVVGVDPKDEAAVEEAVGKLMDPYNEHTQVPEYEEACWCVGRKAAAAAWQVAETEVGTIESFRNSYQEMVKAELGKDKALKIILIRIRKSEQLNTPDLETYMAARRRPRRTSVGRPTSRLTWTQRRLLTKSTRCTASLTPSVRSARGQARRCRHIIPSGEGLLCVLE